MNYDALRQACPVWADYIDHDFVQQLADGSLPKACFQHYLQQDYHFLIHFTRAWALAIVKSDSFAQMRSGQAGVNAMLDTEIGLHIEYCQRWGVSEAALNRVPESSACVAYTRYVLDVGMSGTLAELYVAMAPCVMGYAEIGRQLGALTPVPGNPYQSWIDLYASEEFQVVAEQKRSRIDTLCENALPQQAEKLQRIFDTATRMEVAFWQMSLARS